MHKGVVMCDSRIFGQDIDNVDFISGKKAFFLGQIKAPFKSVLDFSREEQSQR